MSINPPPSRAFSPETLSRVLHPIAEARGLPNEAYTAEDFSRFERDHLFAGTWTCIGVASDVPGPGDVKPVNLLGIPLILLRDGEGGVRVFHNVCSHRGHELVSEPCTLRGALRCPYHSWAYGLDGRLRGTPHIGGPGKKDCAGFDRSRHGLKPVRVAVWFDAVFVNLSGDAPPLEEQVAPLAERWSAFDGSLLRHGGPDSRISFEIACNWKLVVENYCEAYHLPWIHPGLNSYSRLEDHYNIVMDGRFAGQGSTTFAARLTEDGPVLPNFPELPAAWDRRAEYVALFPNLLIGVHRDHVFIVHIEPLAADRTLEHIHIYYLGDAPLGDAYAAVRATNSATWRGIFAEDLGVVEAMQRGRASPAFDGGVFSPVMDQPTHCFHRWIAGALAADGA